MDFFNVIIFIFGLLVGSFLNCVIYRLEEGKSFLKGRSFCPKCKHTLIWRDLVPVFSFAALLGKCRYCKTKISWQYPLVELATALLFLTSYNLVGGDGSLSGIGATIYLLIISSFLIVIFVFDLRNLIIPDAVIFPAIILAFLYDILFLRLNISNFLYSAFGAVLFFLAIFLISRGKWLGFGDVKLALFMGLVLGFPNILVAMFLAFFIGAIIGLGLIARKKKTLKSELPFGPFLITGTFLALFWGKELISWYFNLFNLFP